ncbi:sensor domain-containing diguanylate cyclase [Crenobacter cavernae]|uniref:diguanylate cyclase n=1 Tax=Crenobacter cavernae TaxID=2290923 RepID=A0ABY0FD88_9NEIS|nr:diguanylate cyclase [Crenobacter cavernae]RXZ42032.1 sensor domain-containing diguanylate cyclase [Crenobacter cavernae]
MTRFNRLAIALAGLLTGLLVAMFLLWCFDQSARLSARMARELKLSHDAYYALSVGVIESLDDELRALRFSLAAAPARFADELAELRRRQPLVVDAAAYDATGRRLGAEGADGLGQPWFVGPRRRHGDALYLDTVRRAANGRWLLVLSRPRLDARGRFDGVLLLRFDAAALSRRFARLSPWPGVTARWRYLDGTLIAQVPPAPEAIGAHRPRPDPLAADAARTMTVDADSDEPWRLGPLPIGDWPLFLDVAARRGSVDRLLIRQSLTVGAIGLMALIVVWGFLLALARQHRALHRTRSALEQSYREIHLLHEKLKARAVRDPLTGTYNRIYLDEMLPKEFARAERQGEPVTVVMIDFDHFKRINDSYGHVVGDAALRRLGELLTRWVRAGDIVGRYGGEEFVVVLPGLNQEVAAVRAEQWRAELAATPLVLPGLDDALTVRPRVSAWPPFPSMAKRRARCSKRPTSRFTRRSGWGATGSAVTASRPASTPEVGRAGASCFTLRPEE